MSTALEELMHAALAAGEDRHLAGEAPVLVRDVTDGRNLFPTPGGLEVWRQP